MASQSERRVVFADFVFYLSVQPSDVSLKEVCCVKESSIGSTLMDDYPKSHSSMMSSSVTSWQMSISVLVSGLAQSRLIVTTCCPLRR